jgi:DNA-binding MarR family transcriptional regulator
MTPNPTSIELATYEAGMLQGAAYRNLMSFMTEALGGTGLTVSEWSVLGILMTRGEARPSDIANIMDVKTPMATRLVRSLLEKGLITEKPVSDDQRGKMIVMTKKGRGVLDDYETTMRSALREYLSGVERRDLIGYLRVLEYLAHQKS